MARDGDGLFRRAGLWYFKYKDQSGRYREKSTGKRKQPDAREYKHDFLEKLRQNQLPTDEAKWTLQKALDGWLDYRAATRPNAFTAAERTSARHLGEILGSERRLGSITNWDIRRFQMRRLVEVGPKTINNEVLVLTAVLKSARLWDPLKELYEPLTVPKNGPGQALTAEQTMGLFETARKNDRWFVALCATVLAYASGCRSGEIKKLQLQDLFLDGECPYIRLRAQNTKSRRSREPALNGLGLWAVTQLLARARLLGSTEQGHYLLPADLSKHTKASDPLTGKSGFDPARHQMSWGTAWENLRCAAGMPGLRFHDLRHTHITHAVQAGVPVEVVMAQVGHVSTEMTRHYTHLGASAKHVAVTAVQQQVPNALSKLQEEAPS